MATRWPGAGKTGGFKHSKKGISMGKIQIPDELKIDSAAIEPAFAYLMGRWNAQVAYARQTYGDQSEQHIAALETLWLGARAINQLTCCADEAIHASIAANNNLFAVEQLLHRDLGVTAFELSPDEPLITQLP